MIVNGGTENERAVRVVLESENHGRREKRVRVNLSKFVNVVRCVADWVESEVARES